MANDARLEVPVITQIKGAKNSAPKDEYIPFIQDFIRSGKFSDVADLENAQMKRFPNGAIYTDKELEKVLDTMSEQPETRARVSVDWLFEQIAKDPSILDRIKPFLDSLWDQ